MSIPELVFDRTVEDAVSADCETVVLDYAERQRSRQRIRLASGRDAAIVLARGTTLSGGERLASACGTHLVVHCADEQVSTASTDDPVLLARACYHLGNRHLPLQVAQGWVRYRRDHVIDDLAAQLGLQLIHEDAPFEPEDGAYRNSTAHAHHHG